MPWTKDDAKKHKAGLTEKQSEQWAKVANSALKSCIAKGGTDQSCAASAIRQANSVVGNGVEMHYSAYRRKQMQGYDVTYQSHQGKDYLVVPVVMMVEGVHHGSHGPLLHTINELGKFPGAWNGIPIVIDHPEIDGEYLSANIPDIIDARMVGRVYNTKVDGQKLVAQAWLDEERLRNISSVVLAQIEGGEQIEVSLGMFTEELITEGTWNGEQYEAIAQNHRPDHLALLPGGTGACSIADGCGIRANNKKGGEGMQIDEQVSAMEKKRKALGMSVSEFYAVPRDPPSESKLPIFDAAHVRNAMARFNQTEGLSAEERATARRKILARARHFGIDTSGFEADKSFDFVEEDIAMLKSLEVNTIATNEEYLSLVEAMRKKIDSMDSESVIHFLHEVYDDSIVYEAKMRIGGSRLYKQGYAFNSGVVELQGTPQQVRRKVEYLAVANSSGYRRTKVNINKEVNKMVENAEKCTPCVKKKVDELIANNQGKYTESDREMLETLSETILDKMAKPIEKEVIKEVEKTVEVNKLTPEQQAALNFGMQQLKQRREDWITKIQANSKDVWTDEELKGMSDAHLEKLAKTVKKEETVDYSLNTGFSANASATVIEPLYPAGINVEEK